MKELTLEQKELYDKLTCGIIEFETGDFKLLYANEEYRRKYDCGFLPFSDEEKKALREILSAESRSRKLSFSQERLDGNTADLVMYAAPEDSGQVFAVLVNSTEENRKIRHLEEKALLDPLTKVYNRATAVERIENLFQTRQDQKPYALLVLDIDNFKHVNDTFGHLYGDAVISMTAGSIKNVLDAEDIMGRFGGDEFLVMIENGEPDALHQKLENIKAAVLHMRLDKSNEHDISCSIGVSVASGRGDYEKMFREADSALYLAKKNGKNRYEFFDGCFHGGAISYAQDGVEEGQTKKEHTIAEMAIEIASKSKNAESAITNIMRHAALLMDLDCMQIMRYDLKDDRADVEFSYYRELDGEYNVMQCTKKTGYYSHDDLVIYKESMLETGYLIYDPDFKNQFSFKFSSVLAYSDEDSVIFASTAVKNDEEFCVFAFKHLGRDWQWTEGDLKSAMEVTKILSVYMNSSYVETEREKGLEKKLAYTETGAMTISYFFERTGKITSYALSANKRLAMVHFHAEGLFKVARQFSKSKGEAFIQGFMQRLSEKKSETEYLMVAQYDSYEDFAMLTVFDDEDEFLEKLRYEIDDYTRGQDLPEETRMSIQAAVCCFFPGDTVRDALDCGQDYNRRHRTEDNRVERVNYHKLHN